MKGSKFFCLDLYKCILASLVVLSAHGLHAASPADQEKLASANNGFAFRLLKQVASEQPEKNVFISPSSVSTVLQMVATGAGGQTKAEMQQALGTAGLQQDELNAANQDLTNRLNSGNTNVILTTANAIWYRKEIPVTPEFIACNQQFFGATVEALDFDDPHCIEVMNAWASDKTHGRIRRIANAPLEPATQLLLASAIYFKGKWEEPFEKKRTRDRLFDLAGGRQRSLPMMEQTNRFLYLRGTGYQAVRLSYERSYQHSSLAMYVFLPDRGSGPQQLLEALDGDRWRHVTKPEFRSQAGMLVLPRFKFECGVDLKQPLRALGLKAGFDPGEADFSGISSQPVFISAVRQKGFVEVNEEGTEAAAVTGVFVSPSGREMNPPKPFEMIVDRPFLFLIEDQSTGTILFMGVIFDP